MSNKFVDWLAGLLSHNARVTAVFLMLALIFVSTLVCIPPAVSVSGDAFAARNHPRHSVMVDYKIEYDVKGTFSGQVGKVVECDGMNPYYIGVELREFKEPRTKVLQFFEIPYELKAGTKCTLVLSVDYKPRFSISTKLFEIGKVSFDVGQ